MSDEDVCEHCMCFKQSTNSNVTVARVVIQQELSCRAGHVCDEQKVFPCKSFPCVSEARCIRE